MINTVYMKSMAIAFVAASLFAAPVSASVITAGFTFAVASSSDTSLGTHYHSSTGGDFGNPAGQAEVGRYFSEEVRGLSEYNLTGLTNSATAFVTFRVASLTGLFPEYQTPFGVGTISIFAYQGNNQEDISDYQAPATATIGSFSTAGLSVNNLLSFDIASTFNNAINDGWNSLGIRLQSDPLISAGAMVFNNFRLTTDDQTTNGVPEPTSLALLGLGLAGLGFLRRRRT